MSSNILDWTWKIQIQNKNFCIIFRWNKRHSRDTLRRQKKAKWCFVCVVCVIYGRLVQTKVYFQVGARCIANMKLLLSCNRNLIVALVLKSDEIDIEKPFSTVVKISVWYLSKWNCTGVYDTIRYYSIDRHQKESTIEQKKGTKNNISLSIIFPHLIVGVLPLIVQQQQMSLI